MDGQSPSAHRRPVQGGPRETQAQDITHVAVSTPQRQPMPENFLDNNLETRKKSGEKGSLDFSDVTKPLEKQVIDSTHVAVTSPQRQRMPENLDTTRSGESSYKGSPFSEFTKDSRLVPDSSSQRLLIEQQIPEHLLDNAHSRNELGDKSSPVLSETKDSSELMFIDQQMPEHSRNELVDKDSPISPGFSDITRNQNDKAHGDVENHVSHTLATIPESKSLQMADSRKRERDHAHDMHEALDNKGDFEAERRPRLASIPESEPLLRDPVASAFRKQDGRALNVHVKFDAASPPAVPDGSSSSSSSSSSDDDEVSIAEARPPDGGWGWVVVFASFMVNLIADGITFSFGVFYPHFLEYFGEGKGKTAWIAGIFMAMPLLSGPIASFLTDRYGCRRVTVFGSILAAIGFVISAFVDNMETLFLTFGIMAGFGLSLCYVAAVVIVAYYFETKRSLATGISVCGSGIGTFIFAPLTYVLLDEYGWRGTTLILAGLFLNMAVCGLLFRDLPWTTTMNEEKAKERKRRRERKRNKRYGSSADSFSDSKSSAAGSTKVVDNVNTEAVASPIVPQFSSLVDLPTYMTGGEGISLETFELLSNKSRAYAIFAQNYPGIMLPSRSFSDSGRLNEQSPPRALMSPNTNSPGVRSPTSGNPPATNSTRNQLNDKEAYSVWMKRHASNATKKPPAFLKDLRVHRHSLTYRGAMLNINRYRLRASSCPNIFRNSMTTIAKEKVQWYAGLWDFWDLVVDVLDFSHFLNPAFLLFALSNFLLYMWYDVPYVYVTDHGLQLGFNESQSSMLISVIGILNMFGEIVLGWVGDWECVNPSIVYAGCMLCCGVVTLLMPLLQDYISLACASGLFGLFIAANYSLTSIILVEQITLEKFTNAYGLLLLMQGVANLVGPPLAGWVFDITGSYNLSFYMSGVFIAMSGLIMTIQPLCRGFRKCRKRDEPKTNGLVKQNGTLLV